MIVNDERTELAPEPGETLVHLLRVRCGLASVRHDCTDGTCGACTVLLDGEETRSCMIFAAQCRTAEVRTP